MVSPVSFTAVRGVLLSFPGRVFVSAFQLDAIGLEVGVRESHLHDNFRKKPSAFFRQMNSSATTWSREIYRQFFSSFYQETKRLPRTDVFKGPLVDYI